MTRIPLSQAVAVASIVLLAVLVPVVPLGLSVGPFDVVTGLVPLVLVASLPYLASTRAAGRPAVRFGLALPAAAFFAVGLASIIANPIGLAPLLTMARYAAYVALVVVVGLVTRDAWARRTVLWSLALSGALAVAYSFYQLVRPTKSIGMSELEGASTRVFSTFDNPNFYGEFLVILIPVLIGLVAIQRGYKRVAAVTIALASLTSLLLTYTRGSWLGLAIGLGIAMYMARMRHRWFVVAVGVVSVAAVPGVLSRVVSIFSLAGTASFRLRLWRIAGEVIAQNPFFGIGIGRFYDGFRETVIARPDLAIGYLEYGAHNSLLTIAAETGIIGGLAFTWLLVDILRRGFVLEKADLTRSQQIENAVYTGALAAFAFNALTSNAFQHPKGGVLFWLAAGLQFGVQSSLTRAESHDMAPFDGVLASSWLNRLFGRPLAGMHAAFLSSGILAMARGIGGAWDASQTGRIADRLMNQPGSGEHKPEWLTAAISYQVLCAVGAPLSRAWDSSLTRAAVYAPAASLGDAFDSSALRRVAARLYPAHRESKSDA